MKQTLDKEEFKNKVGICINSMLQNDARGQTMIFMCKEAGLVPEVVNAESIDIDNLQEYEMILFDGGNSHGDLWKYVFFPRQLQYYYVDENPIPKSKQTMEVSLDGGLTYQKAREGVRIIYKNVLIDGEDGRGEVHINATGEGLITDIWTTREEPLDHNIGTDSVTIDDIVSRLVSDNE